MIKIAASAVFALFLLGALPSANAENMSAKQPKNAAYGDQASAEAVDGISSASELRAKRSHAVAREQEVGLAVVSGLLLIAVIVVLLNPFKDKN